MHVVINNESHETVGGLPTAAGSADLCGIAKACGYEAVYRADTRDGLRKALEQIKGERKLTFLEARCAIGARADLGRPTIPARKNKEHFMEQLQAE